MKTKITQILLILFVGLVGVFSVNAQYKINTLEQGQTLRTNQGLRSENGQFNLLLQSDGNLCLYKNGDTFIQCTSTNSKKPTNLQMQEDGNLAMYDAKKNHVWSTDTYRGSDDQKGGKLVLENDGNLVLYSVSGKPIYDFNKGKRLY